MVRRALDMLLQAIEHVRSLSVASLTHILYNRIHCNRKPPSFYFLHRIIYFHFHAMQIKSQIDIFM